MVNNSLSRLADRSRNLQQRIQTQRWHTLMILGTVVAVFLFVRVGYIPLGVKIASSRAELRELAGAMSTSEENIESLERLRTERSVLDKRLKDSYQGPPSGKEISFMLEELVAVARDSGIDFIMIRPYDLRTREHYTELPLDISLRCQYHTLGTFLDKLEDLGVAVRIQSVKITTERTTAPEVKSDITGTAYFMKG
jgi:Tfp pilus assembly protein PilO